MDIIWSSLAFSDQWALVNKIFHQLSVDFGKFGRYVTINKTLSAPPKRDYMCVNSTERKYRGKLHRENTTAN